MGLRVFVIYGGSGRRGEWGEKARDREQGMGEGQVEGWTEEGK